jgi:hypothetical protein
MWTRLENVERVPPTGELLFKRKIYSSRLEVFNDIFDSEFLKQMVEGVNAQISESTDEHLKLTSVSELMAFIGTLFCSNFRFVSLD